MNKDNCASFIWAIHNFSYCWQKTGEAIVSPMFCIYTSEETKWKLLMYPRGVASGDEGIAFYLCRDNDCKGAETIRVVYALDLVKTDGTYLVNVTNANESQKGMKCGSSRYIAKTRIVSRYLQQDILTFCFYAIRINEETTKMRQILARTIIALEKRFLKWTIPNFTNLKFDEMKTFLIQSESKQVIMQVNLSIKGNSEKSICFSIYSFDRRVKFSTMKTFIIGSEKQKIDSGQFQYWFNCGNCAMFDLNKTIKDLMENQSLYLPNDSLTLSFESTVSTGVAFEGIESGAYDYTSHPFSDDSSEDWRKCICHKNILDCSCALITDLTSLREDQSTCDMKLVTKTNIFPVHTLILSARSPVFKAMFSNDMKEKETGCVDVSDLDDETVRRFLLYLYANQLEDLGWNDALHLFNVADKYEVISLKIKCSMFFKQKLNLENACEALLFSDLHQDKDLKETTQDFILNNANDIFKSEEWKILMNGNSKLALETMLRNWKEE